MSQYIVWMQPATGDPEIDVPAAQFRQVLQALAGPGDGVIAPASAIVTHRAAGANFSVDVQPFRAIVAGDDVADQGSYLITSTAVVNVAAPAPPGSGTRTHRLIAQVRDKRSNPSWSTYDWVLEILEDTGSGEPPEPASAITLAHIAIAAGQSSVADSDITLAYAPLRALPILGPWRSSQASAGSWNATATWTDFSAGQWPPLSFTVPPSGKVFVTISGQVSVSNGQASLGWRISGTDVVGHSLAHAYGSSGTGSNRGSRRRLVTGLTPGAINTLTPGWYQSASGNTDLAEGELLVEAVQ